MLADMPPRPALVERAGDVAWTPATVRLLVLKSFPPSTRWVAEGKARCESRFNHRARNASSGAAGVFQFLPSTWHASVGGRHWNPWWDETPYDPQFNIWAARILSRGGTNWSQWSC